MSNSGLSVFMKSSIHLKKFPIDYFRDKVYEKFFAAGVSTLQKTYGKLMLIMLFLLQVSSFLKLSKIKFPKLYFECMLHHNKSFGNKLSVTFQVYARL